MACNFFCDGVDKAPQRSLFNALGMTKEEMDRPLFGIVSSYNEIVPGHMNIDKIVEAVKMGVANSDSREYNRCSACHCNAHFNSFNYLVNVHVTRNYLII